jgi:hypothetical protein
MMMTNRSNMKMVEGDSYVFAMASRENSLDFRFKPTEM